MNEDTKRFLNLNTMKSNQKYNPTCLITGKTDSLNMHSIRDKNGNMIGWVFLHESINFKDSDVEINWKFNASIQ